MSTPTDLASVATRLEHLEQQNRRLRALIWVALAGILVAPCLALALAPGPPEHLWLRGYVGESYITMRDGDGTRFGRLKNDYEGLTLVRTAPAGNRRAQLSLGQDGVAVYLFDDRDQPLSKWSVSKDGARFERIEASAPKK